MTHESVGPKHTHDCDYCVFLGRVTQGAKEVDIWWCVSPSMRSLDSVIGRYGSEGPDYAASHPPEAFADAEGYVKQAEHWYREAMTRAKARGLYAGRFF